MKDSPVARKLRKVLRAIALPEILASRRRPKQKPGQYGFVQALAAEPPAEAEQATEPEKASKPKAKVPDEYRPLVIAALKEEGLEGDDGDIKAFQASHGDQIRYALSQEDAVVREVYLKAAAERYAMSTRPGDSTIKARPRSVMPF